jgi:bidirectional [NiFe] hydrogenase diaphorase subunit
VSTAVPPDGSRPSGDRPSGAPPVSDRFRSTHPGGERPAGAPSPGQRARDAAHRDGDDRFEKIDESLKRHGYAPDALIEVLHTAQEAFGHLGGDVLSYVAGALRLPPSRVYGVATFYHLFTLKPPGEHTCMVCMGTACYVRGAPRVLERLEREAGIRAGRTTPDGRLSLLTVSCPGTCGIAPAVFLDGTAHGHESPDSAAEHLKGWVGDGSTGTA